MQRGITVVIASHPPRNASGLCARAVASALAQDQTPTAIIVETDNAREGAWATRTRGLMKVTTEFTAFLDSDDVLLPHHLSSLMMHQETTGGDLIYPWFKVVGGLDPLACPVGGELVTPYGVGFQEEQHEHLLRVANFVPVTTLVKTELAQRVGGFPRPGSPEWPTARNEDWGFLVALLKADAKFFHLPQITWEWHHHGAGTPGLEGNTSGVPANW